MILVLLGIVVIALIVATTKFKVHPFISLLISSIAIGFLEGMQSDEIINAITSGFGNTLKSIGIIIAFGTIIGAYLEYSGGARSLAQKILNIIGEKKSALAMNITGFIVSIPVFCDSGFVVLSSINKALSKKSGTKLVALAIALSTGLYATHVFVPPTPGPLAAAATLNADIGLVLIFGLIVAIPSALSGLFWGKFISRRVVMSVHNKVVPIEEEKAGEEKVLPNFLEAASPIIAPISLIGLKSIAEYPSHPFGESLFREIIVFLGNPVIALLIGVFLAFRLKKYSYDKKDWFAQGLMNAGVIILITGAGGAFGNVMRETSLVDFIGSTLKDSNIGILLPFAVAAILKTAQGSSTVSIITTAAILSPLLGSLGLDSEIGKVLVVLAIGAGAMTVSHVNDSYFWVVAQFSNMNTATALKSHTMATLFQGLIGIIVIIIINFILL
jgi:gluconate:H+ symporter, GntP family